MINQSHNQSSSFILLSAGFLALMSLSLLFWNHWYVTAAFAFPLVLAGWQNGKLLLYLLLFSLPLSIEYNFSAQLGTDIPDELLMVLLSFLTIAALIYNPGSLPRVVLNHPLITLLVVSFTWACVAALFSTGGMVSLKFILAKVWYFGAFVAAPVLFLQDKRSIRQAALIFILSLFGIVLIALVRHSADNFSFATINDAVQPFFRNHVNYSAMVVCSIPVIVAGTWLSRNNNVRILLVMVLMIMLLATFFSYARGAWLALMVGLIAWWLIRVRALVVAYACLVLVGIAALFYLKHNDRYLRYAHDYQTTIFHKDFKEHIVATYKLKDVSTAERFYRWIAGIRMIGDKAVTGYGPNTFYENYKPYAVPAFKTWISDNKEHSTVHNYFLLLAIEQGIPGLLVFLILLGVLFYYSQRLYHRISDPFYRTVAVTTGVMLSIIMTVNFLSDLIETDKIGSLFFLCLSLLVITDLRNDSRKSYKEN